MVIVMQIGEVIRKYRKSKNMTQEEMACRLGISAPAVNKWENGNSLPDITLLAPIARLLGITLDELLSFREELTNEEIRNLVKEADDRFKTESYEEVHSWVRGILGQYPNCEWLIWQMAVILDARRSGQIPDADQYDEEICGYYNRILESKDEELRVHAADSLFMHYARKEQWDKAEGYLVYYAKDNPERKRKQAYLYSKTGRIQEAYKTYEEILFSGYMMFSVVMHGIYLLAMEEGSLPKARQLVEKQQQMAKLFEMGGYHEVSAGLELAVLEKNADKTLKIIEEMLKNIGSVSAWVESPLYEHMAFCREGREEFTAQLRRNLLDEFKNDKESFGFLEGNPQFQELVK